MTKRKAVRFGGSAAAAICVAAVLVSGGCESGTKDLFGRGKLPPDEFAVYTRAPLSLPPNYGQRPTGPNSLPAPGSGAQNRIALVQPQDEARNALLGAAQVGANPASTAQKAEVVNASAGTRALLQRTGGASAPSDVRAQVNRETQLLAEADRSFIDRLMFWQPSTNPADYGTVVDPAQESRRIQQTQALGEPIVAGETPTIKRKRRGLLEGIIN